MKLYGLQKLSMVDWPGKAVATLFTGGCNYRCPFCHNFQLALGQAEEYPAEDIFKYLEKRRGLLDGVCITGGEPTLNKDLPELLKKIKDMGYGVKLDTNGTNPQMLKQLLDSGLVDYVAMDIKHSKEKYNIATGCSVDLTAVEESVSVLKEGTTDFEFRTTVAIGLHSGDDIKEIGKWLAGDSKYFLQKYVKSDNVPDNFFEEPTAVEMEGFAEIVRKYMQNCGVRGV